MHEHKQPRTLPSLTLCCPICKLMLFLCTHAPQSTSLNCATRTKPLQCSVTQTIPKLQEDPHCPNLGPILPSTQAFIASELRHHVGLSWSAGKGAPPGTRPQQYRLLAQMHCGRTAGLTGGPSLVAGAASAAITEQGDIVGDCGV